MDLFNSCNLRCAAKHYSNAFTIHTSTLIYFEAGSGENALSFTSGPVSLSSISDPAIFGPGVFIPLASPYHG